MGKKGAEREREREGERQRREREPLPHPRLAQVVARVRPLRDFFLEPSNYRSCPSTLVQRTGELVRKLWHTKQFKGQASWQGRGRGGGQWRESRGGAGAPLLCLLEGRGSVASCRREPPLATPSPPTPNPPGLPKPPLAQVSPHEFMQAVMQESGKRFLIDKQSDPVQFLTWLLNALHR